MTAARCWNVVAAVLLSCACAGAQQSVPAKAPGGRITLDVVVSPKRGEPVAGLTQSEFTVLDNKVQQPIASFRALNGAQTPFEVILVVDAVNVPFSRLAFAREEIEKFLGANGGHLEQPTALAILTDTGTQLQQGFTRDGSGLRASFDKYDIGLREIRRSAGFYGASERFQTSLEGMRRLVAREAGRPGRKLLIWISPGWPLLSGPEVDLSKKQSDAIFRDVISFSTQLRQGRVTLDVVNPIGSVEGPAEEFYYEQFLSPVRKPSQVDIGDLGLQVLATQSGGIVLNGNNDIAGLLERCVEGTRSTYEISFGAPPSEQPNEFHLVEVKVDQPGLTVRTRNGYYANPEFGDHGEPVKPVSPTRR